MLANTPLPTYKFATSFLTVKQLAAHWKVHEITLRRWRAEGKLSATVFGRGVRFSTAEIERFERESVEPSASVKLAE